MQRCFLLLVCFLLAFAVGCQDAPKGDPAFKKEKADPAALKTQKGEKQQVAPEA